TGKKNPGTGLKSHIYKSACKGPCGGARKPHKSRGMAWGCNFLNRPEFNGTSRSKGDLPLIQDNPAATENERSRRESARGILMLRTTKYAYLFILALAILAIPATTPAQIAVGISVHIGPPALPVYAQPICPGVGYLWTPGYWSYGPDGYFWVPGTWIMAPTPGFLWTPGYWGWGGGAYLWHGGYWGPHIGFYGGINYGFGYGGVGFVGGEWRGGVFHYNTAVTNVNTTVIHNTYVNKTVINNNTTVNRTSFNGGTGGVTAQPTAAERAAEKTHHTPATSLQTQHEQAARSD